MTGLLVLSFVPFLVAVGFFLRLRSEQRARRIAEQKLRDAASSTDTAWLPILAHELRSPVAAVLGYQELLVEGTFGELEPTALDAVQRIGIAATQLISIIDGVDRLGADPADMLETPSDVDGLELVGSVVDALRADALARNVSLTVEPGTSLLRTCAGETARAIGLALGAAIKSSPGASLIVSVHDGDVPLIRIRGTRLDARADNARTTADAAASGAALRILLARRTLAACGGDIVLVPEAESTAIRVSLPRTA